MTNRCTLAQLSEMTAEQASSLPVDQIAALLEDCADAKANAKRLDDLITLAMLHRYGEQANALRKAEGKDTGRVSLHDGDYVIRADRPKKVDWNQAALRSAMDVIKVQWKEDPAEYVSVEIKVSETKFNAWPKPIRALFEPARTVGTGRASFTIERRKDAP